mgnify:FL=1
MRDAHTPRALAVIKAAGVVAVDIFALAEFASAVGTRLRSGRLKETQGHEILGTFRLWLSLAAEPVDAVNDDHHSAATMLSRFDLNLRPPDALHRAVALRLGLEMLTFDARQSVAARALGVACDPAGAA